MVTKAGPSATDLRLDWGASGGATTYNLWRGDLGLLHLGVYDHEIRDDGIPGTADANYCDLASQSSQIGGGAIPTPDPLPLTMFWFVATGETPCGAGVGTIDGPWGHPDVIAPHPDADAADIPSGRRPDGDCP